MADEAYDEVKGVPEVSAVCCSRRPALGCRLTLTGALPQAHVDDTYDQEGILLKPLAAAQQPSGEEGGAESSHEAESPAGLTVPDTGHSRDEASTPLPAHDK